MEYCVRSQSGGHDYLASGRKWRNWAFGSGCKGGAGMTVGLKGLAGLPGLGIGGGGAPSNPSVAVSGTVATIQVSGRNVHSFTGAGGSLVVSGGPVTVDYLWAGGGCGGNGGQSGSWYGGGGAAGTVRSGTITLEPGTYPITVGTGSSGVISGTPASGGSTTGLGITATGGVGRINTVRTGGSNADFSGGAGAGASSGGGAGAGGTATGTDATNGGIGVFTTLRGSTEWFGGGGGGTRATGGPSVAGVGGSGVGGNGSADGASNSAVANTGSGGGGGNSSNAGGNGSNGIAIIKVLINLPYSLFTSSNIFDASFTDGIAYELGMRFTPLVSGKITHIRYYRSPSEPSITHVGKIWNSSGTLLASATFTGETSSGWQQVALTSPLQLAANQQYTVSTNIDSYTVLAEDYLELARTINNISIPAQGGSYGTPGAFPDLTYIENYLRDFVFTED
jgi:hypothetical protein